MASAGEHASEEPPPPDVPDAMHAHPASLHDYHCFQHDLQAAAHALETPHLPLPLDTPLPPASYEFPTHGTFPGPAAHPLFEGVVAMHHMLGHDLSLDWSDMSACSPSSTMPYPHYGATTYTYQPASQWSSPPTSIVESIPSPLDESPPATPERIPEYSFDSALVQDAPPAQTRSIPQPATAERHSAYPLVVTSTTSYELPVAFQADRQKTEKAAVKFDPHAADFIREKLGEQRWSIFSSRLAERRATVQKPKPKPDTSHSQASSGSSADFFPTDKTGGATVIDFLVKVEVVKSVLRTYVPHPYNPLKALSHAYSPAPSGQVMLSRSTVLSLSGWSNTQFSYWARRAEAISVLAMHDDRLRTAATALERRLHRLGLLISPDASSSSSSTPSSSDFSSEPDAEEWARMYITGKGLDVIIDEVKKRTGVSPFLRGKHSSLDPFGTVDGGTEGLAGGNRAAVYMPTFQAEKYVHELPSSSADTAGLEAEGKKSAKRKAISPLLEHASTSVSPASNEPEEITIPWHDPWATDEALQLAMPAHYHTHSFPPTTHSPEDPNASFVEALPFHALTSPLPYAAQLAMPSYPWLRPKKRRLAPNPSSISSPYNADTLGMLHQDLHS